MFSKYLPSTFRTPGGYSFLARHFSISQRAAAIKVDNVMVIGSGLMGSGVAQTCAQNSEKFQSIQLQDVSQDALDKAKNRMVTNLTRMKQKNAAIDPESIVSKINFTTSMTPTAPNNLLVIEAVPEMLKLKQDIFKDLCSAVGKNESVIFASNTSSLSCKEIAKNVACLERFGGLHFFNPVPLMRLVEVVRLESGTSDDTFEALNTFVKNIGKVPVACKDTPGFIVNRLLIPYMMEAVQLLERGDATARDIDTAMKLGAGYPMGPFELIDYVGLDTTKFILDGWLKEGLTCVKESKTLTELVKNGHFGKKTGKGFYEYKK